MKKIAIGYKGKHFIIADEDRADEFDELDPYVDVDKVIAEQLGNHVADCRYYGIPAYIGADDELKRRIAEIDKKLDDEDEQHPA